MSTIIENLLDDSEQPELLSPKTKNLTDGDFNIIDTTNCTLMCFNINSITHGDRLHELADINNEISAEFIALVETKLDDTISQSIYKIPGYICEAKHRSRHGGGVILYIKEDIPYQRKKNLENKNLEHIACEAIVGSEKYLINVIYRPPNETPEAHDQFISNIEDNKNPGDLFNWTPLHYAALHGHLKICKLIVSNIEDKSPRNICGQTPLDFARKTHKDYAAICDLLRN